MGVHWTDVWNVVFRSAETFAAGSHSASRADGQRPLDPARSSARSILPLSSQPYWSAWFQRTRYFVAGSPGWSSC
jgi:hypothetical protein